MRWMLLVLVGSGLLLISSGPAAAATDLVLVSQNLNRLFDDKDDGNRELILSTRQYQRRLQRVVDKIANDFEFADVLALQEVEHIDVLRDIADLLRTTHRQDYQAYLIEGNDSSGIDVGYLVKAPLQVTSVQALFQNKTYGKDQHRLFARPPLLVEICRNQCLAIVNLHLRSMRGLRSPKKGRRVALKRRLQAETLARWIHQRQQQHPQQGLVISGDFNALNPSDAYVDSLGTILGEPDQQRPRWKSQDLLEPDLIDISRRVPAARRYSYLYKGNKQQLDYILVSAQLKHRVSQVRFSNIDYAFSDHAAVQASLRLD